MSIRFHPLGPVIAAEVTGIDLRLPLTADQAQEIHAGMDRFAVLVFHEQDLTNEQHLAFTQALGPIEHAIGSSLRGAQDVRLPSAFADVSNLDREQKPFARDDRRRLFAIGWRSFYARMALRFEEKGSKKERPRLHRAGDGCVRYQEVHP